MRCLKQSLAPSLQNLSVEWKLVNHKATQQIPSNISKVFEGDTVMVFAELQQVTTSADLTGKVVLRSDNGEWEVSLDRALQREVNSLEEAPVHILAAKTRIQALSEEKPISDRNKKEIIELSTRCGLVSQYPMEVVDIIGDSIGDSLDQKVDYIDLRMKFLPEVNALLTPLDDLYPA
jgi:hypothetical protein